MAPIVFCRACGVGYAWIGVLPAQCPSCSASNPRWSTSRDDSWPFKLTENDRRFLRKILISPIGEFCWPGQIDYPSTSDEDSA
jgi:hypothetical protein